MNQRLLVDAVGEIADRHVLAADAARKSRRQWVRPAVAAAVAAAIFAGGFVLWLGRRGIERPGTGEVLTLAAAEYPKRVKYSEGTYDAWRRQREELALTPEELEAVRPCLEAAVPELLRGREGENIVVSPVNVYLGLAMLARTSGGQTRGQILDLLGARDMEELLALADRVWNALYVDDGVTDLELASSLWLRDGTEYSEEVLESLAGDLHASAFCGEMGSEGYNRVLRDWLNGHTGGLLQDSVSEVDLGEDTVMAMVSTVYFRDRWYFDPELTRTGTFHGPGGDVEAQLMHGILYGCRYYWGDSYGAVIRQMANTGMVLILPDEGVTPEALLSDPQALGALLGAPDVERSGVYDVELTLPRFDVASDLDLTEALRALGITDAFEPGTADFSPLGEVREDGTPAQVYLSEALHGARVRVDEEGCEGAAYTLFAANDAPAPDVDTVVMTFDRPFIFVVVKNSLPVFAGIVNDP